MVTKSKYREEIYRAATSNKRRRKRRNHKSIAKQTAKYKNSDSRE